MIAEWPPFTRTLAEFCSRIDIRDLPESTVRHVKLCILDWISAALAGCQTPSAIIVRKVIEPFEGAPQASIVGRQT